MSQKNAKKLRQMYMRPMREEAIKQINVFQEHLKPKPKWMPKFLHKRGLKIYFKLDG